MNASQPTKAAYFNYIGSIELPICVIDQICHSGSNDIAVAECMQIPEVKAELSEIDPEALRKELDQYGTWDNTQLQDHEANLERILWVAAWDIFDGKFDK